MMTVRMITIMMRMREMMPAMMYIRDSLWMKDLSGSVAETSFMLEKRMAGWRVVVVRGSSTSTATVLLTSPRLPAESCATIA